MLVWHTFLLPPFSLFLPSPVSLPSTPYTQTHSHTITYFHIHTVTHRDYFSLINSDIFVFWFVCLDSYFFLLFYFLCIGVLPAYMFIYHICAWCLQRPEESIRAPQTVITDLCEPQCGLEPWIPGRTVSTLNLWESSLQPSDHYF